MIFILPLINQKKHFFLEVDYNRVNKFLALFLADISRILHSAYHPLQIKIFFFKTPPVNSTFLRSNY
jgi:hypothetical protein